MRKTYGNTWWGKNWLNALSQIDYSNRLPRGRTYANKGLARNIEIDKNKITADVQGSAYKPYQVRFTIPKFTTKEKSKIINFVTSNPLYLSQLLNRVLPTELKAVCDQHYIQLFPDTWRDIKGHCSCPDHAVPCKHMAAVLYLVANEIDKNPFLVFHLHDFDLFDELEKTGYADEGQKEVSILSIDDLQKPFSTVKSVASWDEGIYNQIDFSRIPDCKESLLAILSEKPVFYPRGDFRSILKLGYSGLAKTLSQKWGSSETEANVFSFDPVDDIEVLLDEEMSFLDVTLRDGKRKNIISFKNIESLIEYLDAIPASGFHNFSTALKSLSFAYQLARKLAQQSAMIPQLVHLGSENYKIRWIPAALNPAIRSMLSGVKSILRTDLLFYKKSGKVLEPVASDAVTALLSLFLNHLVKQNHKLDYRYAEEEVGHLFFNNAVVQFKTYETKEYPAAIQLWLNRFFIAEKDYIPIIQVDEDEEQGFWVNVAVQRKTNKAEAPIPLNAMLEEKQFSAMRIEVLRDLAMLAEYFPTISDLVERKGAEDLFFDSKEFVNVLFKILPTIRLFGIKVLLPKSLRKLMRPRMSMRLEAKAEEGTTQPKSLIGLSAMLAFQWQIALGDQMLSEAEFMQMVDQYSGIVKLNDQYVFFDEKEIKVLIEQMKNPPKFNPNKLLQVALSEDYNGAKIKLDVSAQALIKRLIKGKGVKVPKGLKATLRPYQLRGYQWLYKNSRIGFGSLIADDMGLGKTLQVIATLLKFKEDGELDQQKALVIVPTTLLTNWTKEIKKFAPDLIAKIYHGPARNLKGVKDVDVLITTYGVARTDTAKLQKQNWLLIAIDEAQNIKNPGTAQTKAIKKIKAPIKVAMSGTPVENRLSEYWSVFDFSNEGYLGGLKNFKEDFAKPIEIDRDQVQLDKFRKITAPFILRRLKSDKSIIKDLPEKIEKDQFCELSPEQTAIYQNVIETTMQAVDEAEGIERKGLVLKLLTGLKQICNHPTQYLKKGAADPSLSGKSKMLLELLHPILDNGEKTLIFTQYQEMGKLLVEMLKNEFNLDVPFLHGGVSRKKRDEMVDDFQNNRATRILILSLKAGGTGLNLTQANHVIHYDLWWNPAVEAQATDRAYRIGQKRNVMVYRFITQGTFEEKINNLLIQKRELANLTVATGEKWIGDLSSAELREVVKLE